jgi:hypothetical protein
MKNAIFTLTFSLLTILSFSQHFPFKEIIFRIDTAEYYYSKDKIRPDTRQFLPIHYRTDKEIIEIEIHTTVSNNKQLFISDSPLFTILSQPSSVEDNTYRALIQLNDASGSGFIRLVFETEVNNEKKMFWETELLPFALFSAGVMPIQDELFVGEEALIEIAASHPRVILQKTAWIERDGYQYRIIFKDNKPFIHLVSFTTGNKNFIIDLELYKPMYSEKKLSYIYSLELPQILVKSSRLAFLATDIKEFVFNEKSGVIPIEIQMDNHRLLKMNKTYRLENSEGNGILIGEIFTKNQLAGNKVLCDVKLYNIHKSEGGFIYIKDGDQPLFITNFTVLPKTQISTIKISRDGKEWSNRPSVYPGEQVIVKLEGESIHKASLSFEGLEKLSIDTLIISEKEAEFRIQIPQNFIKSRINILNYNGPTGLSIGISEHQKARQFDFISINYGEGFINVNEITGPIFYEGSVRNIMLRPNPAVIDEINRLYGKQYFEVDVKIFGPRGEIIDIATIKDQVICPDETSARYAFYNKTDCKTGDISLNQFLSKKTYDLENWSRITITLKHTGDKYTLGEAKQKTIEIILQKRMRFDVDVSFPAGLLIINPSSDKINNLSGISMAMIAQFSFYQKNKISRLKPYKIGAGFLALNAFNFSDNNTNRDMSIVAIASIYPTRRESKMAFPLYIGGGYFISQGQFFWLLGPGIRVSF